MEAKGFTLSKRGELAVLDELARAMPQGGLELAEPACWGAAASNAVVARDRGAAGGSAGWPSRGAPSRRVLVLMIELRGVRAVAHRRRRRAAARVAGRAGFRVGSTSAEPRSVVDAVNLAVLPISRAAAPRPLPGGTFTWTTPEEDESVPVVNEAPPRARRSAEGKALARLEGVFPVVVAAIPESCRSTSLGAAKATSGARRPLGSPGQDLFLLRPRPGGSSS